MTRGRACVVCWVLGAYSVLVISGWAVVASAFIVARSHLGHWPRLYIDDPRGLGLGVLYHLTGWSVALVLGLTLAGVGITPLAAWLVPQKARRTALVAVAITAASVTAHALTPLLSWYLD
jgi:hypothetical protein